MNTALLMEETKVREPRIKVRADKNLAELVAESWRIIAPYWPLKNLNAVNPLHGLEHRPIEEALAVAEAHFQKAGLPESALAVNRESIKWFQAFFDHGQATLAMPFRELGLYRAWKKAAVHDKRLHGGDPKKVAWLSALPDDPISAVALGLRALRVVDEDRLVFLTLMLTTLPGWAAYVRYRCDRPGLDVDHPHPVSQGDYLAVRVSIAVLMDLNVHQLMREHRESLAQAISKPSLVSRFEEKERRFREPLLRNLAEQPLPADRRPEAQWVFCIDVRSEPFRRALESVGDYQTFGYAGFFGVPVRIKDEESGTQFDSCPVLLEPKHVVRERSKQQRKSIRPGLFKRLYQSVKYTFTTPFALVETLGAACGAWMGLKTWAPGLSATLRHKVTKRLHGDSDLEADLSDISLADRCTYAKNALTMIGLTHHFASRVVLCGHGSSTENNAFASALDCGACGGRQGDRNARILAFILNQNEVRATLAEEGLFIPSETRFLAAMHNTTTDQVTLFEADEPQLIADLEKARRRNSRNRLGLEYAAGKDAARRTLTAGQDWARVRPEWGLARNAAFIIGPRELSQSLDLQARCFLHSYDYRQDSRGLALTAILTAPMIVAQWINSHYLFSTLDNVAFGAGSKVTQNITGKIGVMQGNGSDLMTGLPLQSVFSDDQTAYHETLRLLTVVYAPRWLVDGILQVQPRLQGLFKNGWLSLACIEPRNRKTYILQRDLSWEEGF